MYLLAEHWTKSLSLVKAQPVAGIQTSNRILHSQADVTD